MPINGSGERPDPELTARKTLAGQERKVVVVQGLGFVGAANAAVIAAARDAGGTPLYSVIGVDLPSARKRIEALNDGRSPIRSEDPELDRLLSEAVGNGNLRATDSAEAYALADIVLVDVNLDYDAAAGRARLDILLDALRELGRRIRPGCLIIIETTVPPGTCREAALPLLREEFRRRELDAEPLLAHAYERVMPGRRYVESIRAYWRSVSACSPEALSAAKAFLESFMDAGRFPPHVLSDTTATEMAKVLENSYRAMNIAFIYEWTLLAEKAGVNLFEVIRSIRVRKGTHDNMMLPGFGVGGYCLTKDGYLAQWGAEELLKADVSLSMTLKALQVNDRMPLHTLDLLAGLLGGLRGSRVLICGLSYLSDVADVRNSPTKTLFDALREAGAEPIVHDPIVDDAEGMIPDASFIKDLSLAGGFDAAVLTVRHEEYARRTPEELAKLLRPGAAVVDAFDILDDAKIRELLRRGYRVAGVGKGHIPRLLEGTA